MKITVDVLKVEQSHDLNTGEAQNYLVFSLFGVIQRVPCAPEIVIAAVQEAQAGRNKEPVSAGYATAHVREYHPEFSPSSENDEPTKEYVDRQERNEESKVQGQSLFIGSNSLDLDLSDLENKAPLGGEPVRRPLQISRAPRVVQPANEPTPGPAAPVRREVMADDAGIAQG